MEKNEDMTETVQTRLTPDQKRAAKASAKSLGLTLSAFLRMAVLSKSKEVGD